MLRRTTPSFLCLALLGLASLGSTLVALSPSNAETLRDVLSSEQMHRLSEQNQLIYRRQGSGTVNDRSFLVGIDPNSEFARVWATGRGPELLLNWLGVHLSNYASSPPDVHRNHEFVYAGTTLSTRERQRVLLEILVPHPTYHTMVHFKTLRAFNVYEPPTLDAVAEEELNFKQVKGKYYRSARGQCSVLIKIERMAIVNLSVQQCEYSNLMTDIVNSLDFERLNKKLNS